MERRRRYCKVPPQKTRKILAGLLFVAALSQRIECAPGRSAVDYTPIPMPPLFLMLVGFLQVGWYIGVPWMLWLIWKKVRHLPG
jgi:hypothetical protein